MQIEQRNSITCNATDKMPTSLGCGCFRLYRFGVTPKVIYNLIDFFSKLETPLLYKQEALDMLHIRQRNRLREAF